MLLNVYTVKNNDGATIKLTLNTAIRCNCVCQSFTQYTAWKTCDGIQLFEFEKLRE